MVKLRGCQHQEYFRRPLIIYSCVIQVGGPSVVSVLPHNKFVTESTEENAAAPDCVCARVWYWTVRPHAEIWRPVSPLMGFALAQCTFVTVLSSAVLRLAELTFLMHQESWCDSVSGEKH